MTRFETWKRAHKVNPVCRPGKARYFNSPILVRDSNMFDGGLYAHPQGGIAGNILGHMVFIPRDRGLPVCEFLDEVYRTSTGKVTTVKDLQPGDLFLTADGYLAEITRKYVNEEGVPVVTWTVDLDGAKDDMADMEVPQSDFRVFLVDRQKKNN